MSIYRTIAIARARWDWSRQEVQKKGAKPQKKEAYVIPIINNILYFI